MQTKQRKTSYKLLWLILALQAPFPIFAQSNSIHPQDLGWQTDSSPKNICKGYYLEPNLAAFNQPVLPMDQSITSITADQGTVTQEKVSVLHGDVVVIQSGRKLLADKAVITKDPQTGKIQTIDLYGHIRMYTQGRLVLGKTAHIQLDNESGHIEDAHYRFLLSDNTSVLKSLIPVGPDQFRQKGLTAWGHAESAEMLDKYHSNYKKTTYTTCAPDKNQWHLHASSITIDRQKNQGTAKNVVLQAGDVPIFYWPYLNFPTSKDRKTGFLYPFFSSSSMSGFAFAWPFYLNLAPNYDATFSPTLYSKRGVLVKGDIRYLTSTSLGSFDFGVLPDDKAFKQFQATAPSEYAGQPGLPDLLDADNTRSYFNFQNTSKFNEHWSSHLNYTHYSDDYYLEDFGSTPQELSLNQILQQADVDYADQHWNFTAMLQGYQTLHPVDRVFVSNLYNRLPELDLNSDYGNLWDGLDFSTRNSFTYFYQYKNPGTEIAPVDASRVIVDPKLSWPHYASDGYFIPSVDFDLTDYRFQNQIFGQDPEHLRTLPRVDIDSGLFFDRDLKIGNDNFDQTLEPRLFYLYVPYTDQSMIPIFDSGIVPFTYDQLFRNNRFSGDDRIGDANQISYALTSRFIDDETGQEKLRLSIGEIYYLENRRVTLCSTPGNPSCSDFNAGQVGATPENEQFSPIAGLATYYLVPHWSLNGDLAWDPTIHKTNTADFYLQYKPDERFLINFGYNFLFRGDIIAGQDLNSSYNNLNQISGSIVSPISEQWSGLGVVNYNISQHHPQTYLLGLQYDSCCFAVRVFGGRIFTALNQNGQSQFSNAIYLQFELKGLANIDPANLGNLITGQISGYQDPFAQTKTFI